MAFSGIGNGFVPGHGSAKTQIEHLHRYSMAVRITSGRILDAGCGTGYGSAMLATSGARVVGVDDSREAVGFAADQFRAPNLQYAVGDVRALPFASAAFDYAVCFELIEQVPEAEALLSELVRVLTPDGQIVISTPNRPVNSDVLRHLDRYQRGFGVAELGELLSCFCEEVVLFGQSVVAGSLTWTLDATDRSGLIEKCDVTADLAPSLVPYGDQPDHIIALCSPHKSRLRRATGQPSFNPGRLAAFTNDALKEAGTNWQAWLAVVSEGYQAIIDRQHAVIANWQQRLADRDHHLLELHQQLEAGQTPTAESELTQANLRDVDARYESIIKRQGAELNYLEHRLALRETHIHRLQGDLNAAQTEKAGSPSRPDSER